MHCAVVFLSSFQDFWVSLILHPGLTSEAIACRRFAIGLTVTKKKKTAEVNPQRLFDFLVFISNSRETTACEDQQVTKLKPQLSSLE